MTTRRELIEALVRAVGRDHVLWRPEDLLAYQFDGTVEQIAPHAVVFPATAAEVADVVRTCNRWTWPSRRAGPGRASAAVRVPGGEW